MPVRLRLHNRAEGGLEHNLPRPAGAGRTAVAGEHRDGPGRDAPEDHVAGKYVTESEGEPRNVAPTYGRGRRHAAGPVLRAA